MNILNFLRCASKLKSIQRTGWVERGVKDAESVADHSFMMALMCMVLADKKINLDKTVKMALVHDLAEVETGDIITKEHWPDKGTMNAKDKLKMERDAIDKILSNLDKETSMEMGKLIEEFEEGKTREAMFVKDIDHAERLIQAHLYHKAGNFKKPLKGFWDDTAMGWIKGKEIKALVKNIIDSGR